MIYLLFCLPLIFPSEAIFKEDLYDAMTEEELHFYFQTADRDNIPEYEIVELPIVLPIEQSMNEDGKDNIEVFDYSFYAFQRFVLLLFNSIIPK